MLNQKVTKKVLIIFGLSVILLSLPADAFAGRGHGRHRGHHYQHHYYKRGIVFSNIFDGIDVSIYPYPYVYYDDVYYIEKPRKYIVIKEPAQQVVVIPSEIEIVRQQKQKETSDELFVVNIPNKKGDYSPVTIKRSGEGFIGPQGEYYSEFPTVKQLRVMYDK